MTVLIKALFLGTVNNILGAVLSSYVLLEDNNNLVAENLDRIVIE